MILSVVKDTETAEHVGAAGTFQITELTIENTNGDSVDISKLVDQGIHFHSDDELKTYLSQQLGCPAAHIQLTDVS